MPIAKKVRSTTLCPLRGQVFAAACVCMVLRRREGATTLCGGDEKERWEGAGNKQTNGNFGEMTDWNFDGGGEVEHEKIRFQER